MAVTFSRSFTGIITGVLLLFHPFCFAQTGNLIKVKAAYDPESIPELMNTIPVGFTFYSSENEEEATTGFLNGRIKWKSLEISSPQGTIHNGQFTFDRRKVWNNHHQATFDIKMNGSNISCNLSLPYIEKIRFNVYTDSLKRGEPFYLNVEGKFSSGRIYPLDTGMVAFRKSGGGMLEGQSLLVSRQDAATHAVMVYTWLIADPAMKDSMMIPVKILPNPAHLPTEQQVLHKR